MKIALFDPYLDTMSGGEKYMLTIAQCLSKEHEVTILWPDAQKDEIIMKAKKRFAIDLSSFPFDALFDPQIGTVERYKKSKAYDRIIFLSDGSIPIVGCPLIIHLQSPMEWVKGRTLFNRLKLSRVKNVIVNSEYTKSYIDRTFGVKSVVIYPPVYLQRSYDESKKTKSILNVGRFGINHAGSSFKKQDILAKAFSVLSLSRSDWRLIFVMTVLDADISAFEEFKNTYKHLAIDFILNPSNEVLWDTYSSASIYWHASGFGEDLEKHPDRAEHFGISTVEAMGMGAVPVVVNSGGQKEIVKEGVTGLLWNTEDELITKTLKIIDDPTLRGELASNAVVRSKDFTVDRFDQDLKRII